MTDIEELEAKAKSLLEEPWGGWAKHPHNNEGKGFPRGTVELKAGRKWELDRPWRIEPRVCVAGTEEHVFEMPGLSPEKGAEFPYLLEVLTSKKPGGGRQAAYVANFGTTVSNLSFRGEGRVGGIRYGTAQCGGLRNCSFQGCTTAVVVGSASLIPKIEGIEAWGGGWDLANDGVVCYGVGANVEHSYFHQLFHPLRIHFAKKFRSRQVMCEQQRGPIIVGDGSDDVELDVLIHNPLTDVLFDFHGAGPVVEKIVRTGWFRHEKIRVHVPRIQVKCWLADANHPAYYYNDPDGVKRLLTDRDFSSHWGGSVELSLSAS